MKFFVVIAVFVALAAFAFAAPADEEYIDVMGVSGQSEALEVFGAAVEGRQRICTAALCRALCQALGWPRGSCNAQLLCVCRR